MTCCRNSTKHCKYGAPRASHFPEPKIYIYIYIYIYVYIQSKGLFEVCDVVAIDKESGNHSVGNY